ncbi:hypothetical protein ACIO8F_29750 [Streptomyces sp. NPDC087228]|uniref:hypothetical protein n=1 Tax=Streptomyces sp. NPDC087228 TaxID=3365772 RepID=UPI003826F946
MPRRTSAQPAPAKTPQQRPREARRRDRPGPASLAHLSLGGVDAALDLDHEVIDTIGGVGSARTTSALEEPCGQLADHKRTPVVAGFPAYAARSRSLLLVVTIKAGAPGRFR